RRAVLRESFVTPPRGYRVWLVDGASPRLLSLHRERSGPVLLSMKGRAGGRVTDHEGEAVGLLASDHRDPATADRAPVAAVQVSILEDPIWKRSPSHSQSKS